MRLRLLLALVSAAAAAPALAQTSEPLPSPEEVGKQDGFTVGVGAAVAPDYEGSDDYRLIPGGAIRGRVGGISFSTRGLYLYVDVIDSGGKVDFDAGPIVGVRLNRSGKIKDDVVDLLPELNTAVEVGGFAGVSFTGLTNPYDSLGIRLDVVHDVGNAHESTVISPNVEFSTPLSRTFFVGASLSADFVSDKFADYYFGITPADSLATLGELEPFDADGGMKNWKVGLLANHALSGDLRRGFSIFAFGNYSRLLGDFADSPIVEERGSPNQWFGALGLAYSW